MDDDWHYLIEDEDLSYYSGPLSADEISFIVSVYQDDDGGDETEYDFSYSGINVDTVAASDIPYFLSEEIEIDDGDLDYSGGPLSPDAAAVDLVLNQPDDIEAVDDTEYDFSYSLQDIVVAAQDQIGFAFDDSDDDLSDYDFSYSQQDDIALADVIARQVDDVESIDETEYDFTSGPLSADFVFDIPYASFDDYEETFEGDEYSFYLGSVSIPPVVETPSYVVGGSFLSGGKRKRKRRHEDDEEKTDLEIVVIGKAPNEVITGLVIPARHKPDHATEAKAKALKKRQMQMADDEWFMLN